jgi:hypothetical protein
MKTIFAAALVALAVATTGTVGAHAEKFDAAKFFEKIQLYGN